MVHRRSVQRGCAGRRSDEIIASEAGKQSSYVASKEVTSKLSSNTLASEKLRSKKLSTRISCKHKSSQF